jgi:hypothetical protein
MLKSSARCEGCHDEKAEAPREDSIDCLHYSHDLTLRRNSDGKAGKCAVLRR